MENTTNSASSNKSTYPDMNIHIRKIRNEGIELSEFFSEDWIGLSNEDNIHFIKPIEIQAFVTRVGDEVFVKVTAKSRHESFCYRCLKDLSKDWSAHFSLIFDVDKQKEFIEISDDIRQELILNLPTRILCQEDCKGLCIDCGADLNNEKCSCTVSAQKSVASGQKPHV